MSTLRIPLISLSDEGVEVVAEVPLDELRPVDGEPFPSALVSLHGRLTPVDGAYLFRGEARGEFVHACDRCLADARQAYAIELLWTFEEGPPLKPFEDAPGTVQDTGDEVEAVVCLQRFQGNEIDLAPPLWEELQLAVPGKYLCRLECLGLCPRCGANLNEQTCGCAPEQTDTEQQLGGLSGLKDLFPELMPKKPEE